MEENLAFTRPADDLKPKNPTFVCVISHTDTSEIPGITAAGADPASVKFTPAADAEYLHFGSCKCIPVPPATPDGKPTPAVITRAALRLGRIPFFIVNAGARVKPLVPFFDFGLDPGRNIGQDAAMDPAMVGRAMAHGRILGQQMAQMSDLVVIGESIPGGTTTALAVLCALGVDARFKISSSMPENPHELKNKIVDAGLERYSKNKTRGVLEALSAVGDPMMASVAGIAEGAIQEGSKVLLAGGTQMAAVLAVLKGSLDYHGRLFIGTTAYVVRDRTSDLARLVDIIDPSVPVISCDPRLSESSEPGLEAFAHGFVKEGVGAGGACIASMIKDSSTVSGSMLLAEIEKEYKSHIRPMVHA